MRVGRRAITVWQKPVSLYPCVILPDVDSLLTYHCVSSLSSFLLFLVIHLISLRRCFAFITWDPELRHLYFYEWLIREENSDDRCDVFVGVQGSGCLQSFCSGWHPCNCQAGSSSGIMSQDLAEWIFVFVHMLDVDYLIPCFFLHIKSCQITSLVRIFIYVLDNFCGL